MSALAHFGVSAFAISSAWNDFLFPQVLALVFTYLRTGPAPHLFLSFLPYNLHSLRCYVSLASLTSLMVT